MRVRFLLPTLAVIVLFAVPAIVWLPWHVENLLTSELTRRGKLAAETLDKSAIGALTVYDRGALNQLAKGFIRSNEILYVVILDKDGQNLADSGIDKDVYSQIKGHFPQILKSEADFISKDQWPSTTEPFFHIARPIFYEQLRIGTIVLGISAERISLRSSQLRAIQSLLCGVIVIIGIILAFFVSRSVSNPLQKIALGIQDQSNEQLETVAGRVQEVNQLVESVLRTKNLFKTSLSELEAQKLELETHLARMQEENNHLSSRLHSVTKQVANLQEKIKVMEVQSKELLKLLPLVQFATGIAPEIDTSMRHINQSAEQLREDLEGLKSLIKLYEKAPSIAPEDVEVIRQYKAFINYEKIQQSMDELVSTIRGGAAWTEQLAELLKQLSASHLTKVQ